MIGKNFKEGKMKAGMKIFGLLSLILIIQLNFACAQLIPWSPRVVAWGLGVEPGEREPIIIERNVMVEMRDGVKLAIDIYRPKAEGKYPVILCRMPYGTDNEEFKSIGKLFVRNGYIFAIQDTRGTFDSEGIYFPLIFEQDDGKDTVEWISRQSWFNGKLGTWGGSYFGYTQWALSPGNEKLTAMNQLYGTGSIYKFVYRGGALSYVQMVPWNTSMENAYREKQGIKDKIKVDLLKAGYYNEPIRPAEPVEVQEMLKKPESFEKGVLDWLHHPGDIAQVPALNFDQFYSQVSAPSLQIEGWYDQALGPALDDFVQIQKQGIGNAQKTRMIIGPWVHNLPGFPNDKRYQQGMLEGLRIYGGEMMAWFDYWLKGIDTGIEKSASVKIFVMGENIWREEWEWPLARTQWTKFYIHSQGKANSINGDGGLSATLPKDEPEDKFIYDPNNPAPTRGGAFLPYKKWKAGAFDQSKIEERDDVLVYVSEPLTEKLEVTGPVKMVLYAETDVKDTDFTAKLVDIYPDGKAYNLCDGIIRARYRESVFKPTPLEPGKIYKFEIDLWATSNVFLPGHRIGLEISSSNFPQYDRNTNCAGEEGADCKKIAHQTVYHNSAYPSYLYLPVIPR